MRFLFLKGPSLGILILRGTVPQLILIPRRPLHALRRGRIAFFIKGPSHEILILKGTVSLDSYSERDRIVGFLFLKRPFLPHVIFIVKGTVAHDSNCVNNRPDAMFALGYRMIFSFSLGPSLKFSASRRIAF
jgi:hypothetical protein